MSLFLSFLKALGFLLVVWMAHSSYKNPWLSSFPSPEVYPFDPRHVSPSRFSGEETETSAWTLGLFFISASPKLRARLSFPSYTWKEAAGPALNAPLLAADAHSLSFSPWASVPLPQWAFGTRGLVGTLASALQHRTCWHQWKTARSVSVALSPGSLRDTFSAAICSLSPLWTMLLFKASDSSSLSHHLPPPFRLSLVALLSFPTLSKYCLLRWLPHSQPHPQSS